MEVRTKKVERKFVTTESGEYPLGDFLDVIDAIEGTDGFVGKANCTGVHGEIATELVDRGLASKTASGAYFSEDDDGLADLRDQLHEQAGWV